MVTHRQVAVWRRRVHRMCAVVTAVVAAQMGPGMSLAGSAEPLPSVVPGFSTLIEGDAGTTSIEIPVSLSASSADTVTAEWTTLFGPGVTPPVPATPGEDFDTATGTVTFAPGDTTETISITVTGDTTIEPDEYIVVSFTDPTNAVMGGFWGLGFGIIINDEFPPPRTLSIRPPSGINGGDTVTVQGTGWTPGAEIGMCQAVNDSTIRPPESACLADNVTVARFAADANGAFSVQAEARRWGYSPGFDGFIDCTSSSPSPGCVFGAGEIADIATITTAPLVFGPPPPPPATRGSLVVSPTTDLVDGQVVLISGAGYRPDQPVDLYQCVVEPVFGGPVGCEWSTRVRTTSDGAGAFSSTFAVARSVQGVDCATRTCLLVAAEAVDFDGTYVVEPTTFAPPGARAPG